ncbi:ImmA/IrrE family metallo-endopeptidase [Paremcibacter congregatus]|uniref:Zinc peptidase n=1 Tax=Paremcibacter congregatus TaxID=2043170 RepID=A0A2G4YQW7_9PROT|nr:ImmA/IrrE family metallo-endopeptidase [Paremcibacter congregatus]PHZ84715.1 zinc peptidase [Paremcibacter congregatus]QDE28910.1 ImmA/IrrE family metallo-endopeptidase [Paremcibacter congregatus]
MGYRRGFKAEAEWYALEFRRELQLSDTCPLNPRDLADLLSIPLMGMSELSDEVPQAVEHFSTDGESSFSGLTVFHGSKRLVIYNDNHGEERTNSNIAHELSHGILGHPITPPMCEGGMRNFNQDIEDEANFLAGALLLPKPAAKHALFSRMTTSEIITTYGISKEMIIWRLNISGAQAIFARSKRRRY